MFSPNGIRAILFDLDGTLRYSLPSPNHTFYDHAFRLGTPDSPEQRRLAARWTHYYWAQSPELMRDLETFKAKEEEFWTYYSGRHLVAFGCPPEQAQELAPLLHGYMRDCYKPEDWVPPEVPDMLHRLQTAGFRLAVLSNRTLPCDEYIRSLGLFGYFDFALVAGQVSCWKPEPEIFLHALQRMELQPEEAIYVGDNYFADVIGAQRAGLRPVLIDSEGLFPDAECAIIQSISELPEVLARE